MRTNKQILAEAQSIVYQNLNLRMTDQFVLAAFLFPPDQQTFKFANIRSLSVYFSVYISKQIMKTVLRSRYGIRCCVKGKLGKRAFTLPGVTAPIAIFLTKEFPRIRYAV